MDNFGKFGRIMVGFILGMLLGFSLMMCGLCSSGCSSDGSQPSSFGYVAGFYQVMSGTQHILDSWGADEKTDLAGLDLVAAIAQNGDIVEFFGCMGAGDGKQVKCDTDSFGTDMFFGPYYKRVQGRMEFNNGILSAHIVIQAEFPAADYSGSNDLELEAVYDYTLTDYTLGKS